MAARRIWPVAVLAFVAACSSSSPGPGPDPDPKSELVGSWSQADASREWIDEVMPISPAVLASDADRESWLEEFPGAAATGTSFDALRDVDLTENFIVIGGYARCTEHSIVTVSDDGDVTFEVRDDEPQTDCAWSPYTIDAWAVPLDLTGGQAPDEVAGDAS